MGYVRYNDLTLVTKRKHGSGVQDKHSCRCYCSKLCLNWKKLVKIKNITDEWIFLKLDSRLIT